MQVSIKTIDNDTWALKVGGRDWVTNNKKSRDPFYEIAAFKKNCLTIYRLEQIGFKRATPRVVSQTLNRFFLDLPDSFSSESESFTDFLQCQ